MGSMILRSISKEMLDYNMNLASLTEVKSVPCHHEAMGDFGVFNLQASHGCLPLSITKGRGEPELLKALLFVVYWI